MQLIPKISQTGIFDLDLPFKNKLLPDVVYVCVAVRRIDELINSGVDPFKSFYLPHNLDITKYEQDVANGMLIVTIKAIGTQELLHVPSTYILGLPKAGGVAYTALSACVELGPLPNDYNLQVLKDRLKDLVKDVVGIANAEVFIAATSTTKIVSDKTHEGLVAARQVNIAATPTDRALLLAEIEKNRALTQKVAELEKFIIDNAKP